jgi:hypothetical protein
MKKIEIITTQNVPIQYESADLKDRVIATILDLVFLSVITGGFFAYHFRDVCLRI